MYPDWVWMSWGVLLLWLLVLSFLVWKEMGFFKSLFPKSGERDIRKKFVEVLELINNFRGEAKKLEHRVTELESLGLEHIQRVKLLRYNPYEDTGGDISFSIALLDKMGSGIVLTSLHARSGTRVFAKEVIKGESSKQQFSKEEQEVIEKALK